ncbi:MAG: type I restriction endonuclease subunit R [Chitinispirillaceae bacterium]|nr:type I restriction endonuclease subunit R [Chitinispirillaceae bacterium]
MISESHVESAALDWLKELGYSLLEGPAIAPAEEPSLTIELGFKPERTSYSEAILPERLKAALSRLNPGIPQTALEDAYRKITITESPSLFENNRTFQRYVVEGIPVTFQQDGRTINKNARLFDFEKTDRNDFVAVNQFTMIENKNNRRPDIVVFVNGLPLAVVELKNPTDENATTRDAFNQLQTYKAEIPTLFVCNELLIISDGLEARAGSLTADWSWFLPWRTIDGKKIAPKGKPELEVLLKGMFQKEVLLDYIRHFVTFNVDGSKISKKIAGYHQYHAVNKAVACTVKASSPKGNKKVGVVWHTQGSGKSLSMAFYAGKVVQNPAMENPTLVVLTDRNDLDDQLFDTFCACNDLLRQKPVQVESRRDLKEKLKVASGGVIFTTIQKFLPEGEEEAFPLLSERHNIIFIADEAHRSQYGFSAKLRKSGKGMKYGYAKYVRDALPNASYIGFTGTPVEKTDRNTPAVFGDYIDIYDISRAVEDGATVRIFYESRLAKIELNKNEKPKIDPEFEDITEDEEAKEKERLKSKWAQIEAMVGTEKRVGLIAKDIVAHFENRLEALDGKGMIVCMSRRICVDLYNAIIKLRPQWHSGDDNTGFLKIVMTGSASDPKEWQQHIRNTLRRKALSKKFKDPKEPFKLVIVRDMWLTGFDAPSLHTMYVDKPMQGHNLMQAIARVNRVFKDKRGGLVADYLGIAYHLKKALAVYTERDQKETGISLEEAAAVMLEKYEIVCGIMRRFDRSKFFKGTPKERLQVIPEAMEHVLKEKDGKERFVKTVSELSKAYSLAVPHEKALKIREDVAFFQAVKAAFVKMTGEPVAGARSKEDIEQAIKQLVSKAVVSDKVVDILSAAGIKTPDISILSDEFLDEIKGMKQKNLAVELLRKLLNDEIKLRSRKNLIQSKSFAEMLEKSIAKLQKRTIEATQVILELIDLAKQMREAHKRGDDLKMTEDELAFYDALEVNDSAVKVLGDETLRIIAQELVRRVRENVSIDWTVKESVRAKIRLIVKKILNKYGYPPDKQEKATQTVLQQAEMLCKDWAV